ncbi:hypothetical protein ACGFYZ_08120 [Streptomyces sp. NPDC048330]|uniref:hypothetical protein n=1 Tax=Streptomyces sp. NPDC048330 TaxID=3365533 RepID=UPI003713FACC
MTALDGAERLRQPAKLPRPSFPLRTMDPYKGSLAWAASCTWVVDELLRKAGIHTCPPPRSTAILYASMHGGAAPSIGELRSLSGVWNDWTQSAAPFESCADATYLSTPSANYGPVATAVNRAIGDGLWLEGWVNTEGGSSTTDKTVRYRLEYETQTNNTSDHRFLGLEINFTTGVITASHGTSFDPALNQRVTWTPSFLTGNSGVHHFGWWVEWSSTGVPTVVPYISRSAAAWWYGGNGVLGTTPSPPGDLYAINLGLTNIRAEAMQVSKMKTRPATHAERTLEGTWIKGGTLGKPDFQLASIPKVSGDSWSVITEIAKKTLSTVEFDRDGFFRMQGYSRWATAPSTPAVTVSSARELASLTVSEEIDACRNDVTVKWANYGGHDYEYVGVKDENVIAIPSGFTTIRSLPISEDRYDCDAPSLHTSLEGIGLIVLRTGTLVTSPIARGVAEWEVRRDGGQTRLSILNRGPSTIYYYGAVLDADRDDSSTKTPATSVSVARDIASQVAYGVQAYEHDATPWVQFPNDATELADALLKAAAFPAPLLQSVEILPDPRIDLGDVVRVVDSTGAALDTLAWVVGVRTEGSDAAVTQTLTLRGAQTNGTPKDQGLFPDPPTRPGAPPPR